MKAFFLLILFSAFLIIACVGGGPSPIAAQASYEITLITPSSVTRTGGAYALDATLQFQVQNNSIYTARALVAISGGANGNFGILAPAGCSVSAVLVTPMLDSNITPIGYGYALLDGASLNTTSITFSGSVPDVEYLVQMTVVVGSSGAGAVGIAWNGTGGSMQIQKGSTLTWQKSN